MADIYISKPKKTKFKKKKKPAKHKTALTDVGKEIKRGAKNTYKNPLAAFYFMPAKVNFETKERKEKIVLMVRKHPVTNVPWLFVTVVFLLLPRLFVFLPVIAQLPSEYRLVLSMVWYLIVIAYVLENFLDWFYDVNIITDERVVDIDFHNLIYKQVSDAKLDKIQDITYNQGGVARTLFNYGDVFIQTAAEVPAFEFLAVPRPDRIVAILRDLILEEEQEVIEGRAR